MGAKQLFNEAGQDAEMREMAREEIKMLESRQEELESQLMILMLPTVSATALFTLGTSCDHPEGGRVHKLSLLARVPVQT